MSTNGSEFVNGNGSDVGATTMNVDVTVPTAEVPNEFAVPVTMRVKSSQQHERISTSVMTSGRRSSMIDDLVKQRRDVIGAGSQLRGLGSMSSAPGDRTSASRSSVVIDLPTIAGLKPLTRSIKAPSQLTQDSDRESRRRCSGYQSVMSGPFSSTSGLGLPVPGNSVLNGIEAKSQMTMQQRRSSIAGYSSVTQVPFPKIPERANVADLKTTSSKFKPEVEIDRKLHSSSYQNHESAADSDSGIEEIVTKPETEVASSPSTGNRATRPENVADATVEVRQLRVDDGKDGVSELKADANGLSKTNLAENQGALSRDSAVVSGSAEVDLANAEHEAVSTEDDVFDHKDDFGKQLESSDDTVPGSETIAASGLLADQSIRLMLPEDVALGRPITSSSASPTLVSASVSGTWPASGDELTNTDEILCHNSCERTPETECHVEMTASDEQLTECVPSCTLPPLPDSLPPPPPSDYDDESETHARTVNDSPTTTSCNGHSVTNGFVTEVIEVDDTFNKSAALNCVTSEDLSGKRSSTTGDSSDSDIRQSAGLVDVVINKGVLGMGFCVAGGKGSSVGDQPIYVKRVFKGSVVQDSLSAGDEIHLVNGESVSSLSHFEAWNLLKQLPDGPFTLTIRRK